MSSERTRARRLSAHEAGSPGSIVRARTLSDAARRDQIDRSAIEKSALMSVYGYHLRPCWWSFNPSSSRKWPKCSRINDSP